MLSKTQMSEAFSPHEPYRPMVGFEYEIQCFERETLRPLRFEGQRGLGAILKQAAKLTGGDVQSPHPGAPASKVSLPDHGLLSLEPGGQLEFSSAPKASFSDAMDQFDSYLALLSELQQQFDFHCFYGGVNPVHTVEDIGLVTANERYRIMDAYYPGTGTMGRRMMRQSCSIQVSFDFRDRQQGEKLLRTALYVAPFVAAMFSNSPYVDGRDTGYRSFRAPIWSNTDPAREGLVPGFTRPDFGFDDYLSHVLRAPMFFVETDHGLVDAGGMTFDQFNQRGFAGREATFDDFVLHNSTIFTDVRLKNTAEVRSVDSQDPVLLPAVLALLCGILFCERSRIRSRGLLAHLSEEDYRALPMHLSRDGIDTTVAGQPVSEIMLELIQLASRGLPTCFMDGADATRYLDPLRELVSQKKTPADVVRERFGDDPLAWLKSGRTFE